MSQHERIKDELLVLEALEGNADAFAKLVDRWQPAFWRHACRLTGDQDAAYDVIQEAWIGIIRGLNRLKDVSCFRDWAYAIVSRKAHDWIRRRSRQRDLDEQLENTVRDAPCETEQKKQNCQNVREALACLTGADRAVLALRYEEQFTTAEIADILEIPEGTVKSRLHHARRRLRDLLEQ